MLDTLKEEITACRLCADRFAATRTAHAPHPVVWFEGGVRILIAGQAPGMRVHKAGKPFFDRSGDRLRNWMGIGEDVFYDRKQIAVLPMAFCFPGYDFNGTDLPPPAICAETWHGRVMEHLRGVRLTLLVGGYAHRWHLGTRDSVTDTVANWRAHAPRVFPLPHPSWRNTAWLKRNPRFDAELVPELRRRVAEALDN